MSKKTKRIFLAVLFAALILSLAAFYGCGKDKPTEAGSGMFREGVKTDILVGSCIDVEDYVVQMEGALSRTVRFKYLLNGAEQIDTVSGATYYPMTEGEYTLLYQAELSDKILSADMKLNVYGEPPEIVVADYPLVYDKGDTVKFSLLLMAANPYSPDVNKFKIEKVEYFKSNIDLEESSDESKYYETVFTDEDRFTFDEYGTYVFTFSGTAGDKTSYETLRVEVVEGGLGNSDVLVENEEYVMKNAQLSGNLVRLVQAEYASASYVVMDGEYYDQDVIRVEFKGKNCPNIGFLTIPDVGVFNPYDLFGGYGYTFSMEHLYTDKFSIYGYGVSYGKGLGRFGGMNLHNGNSVTGYMGRDNLENDKYYAIELNIDSGSVENLLTVFRLRIFEIENYGEAGAVQTLVYKADVPANNEKEAKLTKGKLVFYGSAKEDIVFRYVKPTTKVENFTLSGNTVTWDAVAGAEYFVSEDGVNYTKQTENSYTFDNFISEVTPLYVKTAFPGSTLLGGAAVFNTEETEAYAGDAFIKSESAPQLTQNVNGAIKHVNAVAPFISAAKQSYVVTKNDYAPGTYLLLEFRGAECPGRIVFGAQNLGETADSVVGTGFYFDNNWGTTGYYKKDTETAADVSMEGDRFISKGKLNRGYLTGNEGIYPGTAANNSTNFILAVSADNAQGGVELVYYLYKRVGADDAELLETSKIFISGATLSNGKIAVFSSNVDTKITTKVKLHVPADFVTIDDLLYAKYSARMFVMSDYFEATNGAQGKRNADDTLDISLPLITNQKYNYIATKQSYAPGTFVMLEFKGAAFPGEILFGADNISDVTYVKSAADATSGIGWSLDRLIWGATGYYKKDAQTAAEIYISGNGYINGGRLTRGFFNENTDAFPQSAGNKTKDFVVITGASNVTGGVKVEYVIFEKNSNGTLTLIENNSFVQADATLSAGKIFITSSCQIPGVSAFKYFTPGTFEEVCGQLESAYGYEYYNPQSDFTFSKGAIIEKAAAGTFDITLPFISGTEFNYVATNTSYDSGTFVMAEFKGANYPAHILFGVQNPCGAPDTMIGTGWHPDKNIFSAYYYHKADENTAVLSTGVAGGKLTRGFFLENKDAFADSEGNKAKDFVLIAGATENTQGIVLEYSLYEKNGTELTLIETKDITVSGANLQTGKIVIAGTNVVPTVNAQVRLYTPAPKAQITNLLNGLYTVA